jgi:AcrR family transcriptional regulator
LSGSVGAAVKPGAGKGFARARLLDAAFEEFAQHGLAGARVDRIAEAAQANKGLIYVYYGNKEQLFDTVLTQRVGALFDAVPFTAADLPGFAGALFDYLLASPKLLRLNAWRQLERGNPPAVGIEWGRETIEAITQGQQRGVITTELEPADLLTLMLGIITSWFHVSPMPNSATQYSGSPQRLHQRRAALTTAVRRLVAPSRALRHLHRKIDTGLSAQAAGEPG